MLTKLLALAPCLLPAAPPADLRAQELPSSRPTAGPGSVPETRPASWAALVGGLPRGDYEGVVAAPRAGIVLIGPRAYELASRKEVYRLPIPLQGHKAHISAVACAPQGILAYGTGSGVVICETATGRELARVETGTAVDSLAFSTEGALLAAASFESSVLHVLEVATRGEVASLRDARSVGPQAFHGPWLVVPCNDPPVSVWNPLTGERGAALPGHEAPADSAAWSPNGELIATGSSLDHTVRLFERTGRLLWTERRASSGTQHPVRVAFTDEGNTLEYSGIDGVVRHWELLPPRRAGAAPRLDQAAMDRAWTDLGTESGLGLVFAEWDPAYLRRRLAEPPVRAESVIEALASPNPTERAKAREAILVQDGDWLTVLRAPMATARIAALERAELELRLSTPFAASPARLRRLRAMAALRRG